MTVCAVIFDLGHTLWDFVPNMNLRRLSVVRLHKRLSREFGEVPPPSALDTALHAATMRAVQGWSVDHDDLAQTTSDGIISDMLLDLSLDCPQELVAELTATAFGGDAEMPRVEPDTLWTLGELDRIGLAMACVTNTILTEPGIHDVLERLGLHRYIRVVVVSSAAGHRKPHPSLFWGALEGLGAEPATTVFVGDRLQDDIGGAQAAGMRAILTHQYRQEPVDDAGAKPDAIVERLSQLPGVIHSW